MKKLDDFTREETGEEWLREVYKVVARRRGIMFRMVAETVRILLLGNAGGAALIIGFMSSSTIAVAETPLYHYLSLSALLVFAIGTLSAALTMLLVTVVTILEAHGNETGLSMFVEGQLDRSQVLFSVDQRSFRVADWSTFVGIVSSVCFLLGGLICITLIVLFF
ncbi:MAG: hypothetical protein OXH90_07945 [Paracoccaceae bacterium]|nr:hypothetical protein [Paracoccaceae bacterium]MDE2916817.1 hypothetical protein [Paracoccaceae bacterium]